MSKLPNNVPVKIIISMALFTAALCLAWAGYEFGQWLKEAAGSE